LSKRDTIIDPRGGKEMAQAYCVKCKKKVEIQNARQVTLKNKRPAVKGVCPKCGTAVFRIGKA
jgi:RNase P subunit RPR2